MTENILSFHAGVWAGLQRKRDRLPHALLFAGQAGIGKLALAEAFARGLLCEAPAAGGHACGRCAACGWLALGNHPDFRLVRPRAAEEEGEDGDKKKASREITIDQVRALDDFLHVGTHRSGYRLVLIEPAEAMNRNTANALLKSLEEPAAGTVFVLVSHALDRLLPTIRSRCQTVPVPLPERSAAGRWLAAQGIGDGERWLAIAGGAPRLAQELAAGQGAGLLEAVSRILAGGKALAPVEAAAELDKLVRADAKEAGLRRIVDWTQRWLTDVAAVQAGLPARYFAAQAARIAAVANDSDLKKVLAFGRKAVEFKRLSEHTLNPRLFLEDFFFEYQQIFDPIGPR